MVRNSVYYPLYRRDEIFDLFRFSVEKKYIQERHLE